MAKKILLLNMTDKVLHGAEILHLREQYGDDIKFDSWFPSDAGYESGCKDPEVIAVLLSREAPLYPTKKMLALKSHIQFTYLSGRELQELQSTNVFRKRVRKPASKESQAA